jgi:predicted DCC family thiol-disulfide oxidoreductase YuxK
MGEKMQNQNLLTVYQFCAAYPAFKIGGMRAWIFKEHQNGLAKSGAVLRIGRKILIDPEKFFEWVEAQNKEAA